ncbi:MAG TPA: HAD-IIIC family phosphatase [Ktedonobacterales bacterium]
MPDIAGMISPDEGTHDLGLTVHIARYYLSHRNPDAARALLQSVSDTSIEQPQARQQLAEAYASLAQAYVARKQAEDAAIAVARAQQLADIPTIWAAAASVARLRGEKTQARDLLHRIAEAQPHDASAWLALARAYEATGDVSSAVETYVRVARLDTSHATTLSLAEKLATLAPPHPDLAPPQRVRIAILGSSTLDYVRSYLEVACRLAGLTPAFYLGPFDQYAQDILNPASEFYTFAPDVVILAIHGRALFPGLYDAPFDLDPPARRDAARSITAEVAALLRTLTSRTDALVLLHTFATPQYSPIGMLDLRDEFGQAELFQTLTSGLADQVRREFPSVYLIDEDRVYGRIGKRNVTDPRLWFMARMGIGEGALGAVTSEYMRAIKALKGLTRKCLVLDLDNTLWGGVVGEDGPHGIALGQEAPGNAYRAFQEAILSLWKRGVILAINSKNNEADALEVLEQHPDMVLRPSHFAAMRINWLDKATNLRSIAEELNIGLDSMVFVDDNPAECALVRSRLPQVLTVALPQDPALYRGTLLALTDFDTLTLTDEDRKRGQLYALRRERQQWEASHSGDLGGYLSDLQLQVKVEAADTFAIPRITQLIGKTNQFNVTTRRHSETMVRSFAASGDSSVYSVRVQDRFGDHGLVGAAIVKHLGETWEIDSLLMSCRVLARGVETALLSVLADTARQHGASTLRGVFIPTAKNAPARDFYRDHGFSLIREEQDGTQIWELDLHTATVAPPSWLTLQAAVVAERR